MKVGFTLLHYNNIQVTCKSVEYLKKLKHFDSCEVIIVDNASPNGTGTLLKDKYIDSHNITVIVNQKNGGFAYGNNIGYSFAKQKGCDIIAVMNSDIFIKDIDFLDKLKTIATGTNAEIIAPNIIGRKGNQNPFRLNRITDSRAKKMLWYNTIIHTLYCVPLVNKLLATLLDNRLSKKPKGRVSNDAKDGIECIPHGSCVIFHKSWIEKEDFAFVPGTFMYFEEDVLGEYLWKKKYRAVYKDQLKVFHVEDSSVEYDNKSSLRKRRFISGCMKKSIKIMLKIRNEDA